MELINFLAGRTNDRWTWRHRRVQGLDLLLSLSISWYNSQQLLRSFPVIVIAIVLPSSQLLLMALAI
jgi:hypothetical protein